MITGYINGYGLQLLVTGYLSPLTVTVTLDLFWNHHKNPDIQSPLFSIRWCFHKNSTIQIFRESFETLFSIYIEIQIILKSRNTRSFVLKLFFYFHTNKIFWEVHNFLFLCFHKNPNIIISRYS